MLLKILLQGEGLVANITLGGLGLRVYLQMAGQVRFITDLSSAESALVSVLHHARILLNKCNEHDKNTLKDKKWQRFRGIHLIELT